MLIVGSALRGHAIEARDGRIGTAKTFLSDDMNWKIRWQVVDTGHWLMERQVLVHPSAVGLLLANAPWLGLPQAEVISPVPVPVPVTTARALDGLDAAHALALAARASSDGGRDPADAVIRAAAARPVAEGLG